MIGRTMLGRYRIDRFLGAGSNADVFLAQPLHPPMMPVVVKRIKPHVTTNPRFRQFFDNEVRSMIHFNHPYAVRLLDASLDDPLGPCLVLEYIPGVTLEDVLRTFRKLPLPHAARLIAQLCHALMAAHKIGIVHRDLKPANLMVQHFSTPDETLKVMDFGFAGFISMPHISLSALTGKGQHFACGTPAYVSPEMIRGDSVDGRADLYAVGIIAYELISGRLPFEQLSQEKLLDAHVNKPPPKFASIGVTDVPAGVELAIQVALSKFPNERHPSVREFAEQFCKELGSEIWDETVPQGFSMDDSAPVDLVECELADSKPAGPEDKFTLFDQFEAMLPEKLAAAKLRGFINDVGAVPIASEPGLIRFRIDLPPGHVDAPERPTRSGIMNWISSIRKPNPQKGREPIEIDLRMQKIDANKVAVLVSFRPLREFLPDDEELWTERCDNLYTILRRYLMAD